MAPLFGHYGIQLWTPEIGALVDCGSEDQTVVRVLAGVLPGDRASWRLAHGAAGASG